MSNPVSEMQDLIRILEERRKTLVGQIDQFKSRKPMGLSPELHEALKSTAISHSQKLIEDIDNNLAKAYAFVEEKEAS